MNAGKSHTKKARRPSKNLEGVNVALGLKKAPAAKGEVTGHISPQPGAWYICWCCAGTNWVPGGWAYFICWNDGALNLC